MSTPPGQTPPDNSFEYLIYSAGTPESPSVRIAPTNTTPGVVNNNVTTYSWYYPTKVGSPPTISVLPQVGSGSLNRAMELPGGYETEIPYDTSLELHAVRAWFRDMSNAHHSRIAFYFLRTTAINFDDPSASFHLIHENVDGGLVDVVNDINLILANWHNSVPQIPEPEIPLPPMIMHPPRQNYGLVGEILNVTANGFDIKFDPQQTPETVDTDELVFENQDATGKFVEFMRVSVLNDPDGCITIDSTNFPQGKIRVRREITYKDSARISSGYYCIINNRSKLVYDGSTSIPDAQVLEPGRANELLLDSLNPFTPDIDADRCEGAP